MLTMWRKGTPCMQSSPGIKNDNMRVTIWSLNSIPESTSNGKESRCETCLHSHAHCRIIDNEQDMELTTERWIDKKYMNLEEMITQISQSPKGKNVHLDQRNEDWKSSTVDHTEPWQEQPQNTLLLEQERTLSFT